MPLFTLASRAAGTGRRQQKRRSQRNLRAPPGPCRSRDCGVPLARFFLARRSTGMRTKVKAIETLACDAGWRNYHFLKLTTEEGVVGWSEFDEGFGSPGV